MSNHRFSLTLLSTRYVNRKYFLARLFVPVAVFCV
jgi:hypothetical protein